MKITFITLFPELISQWLKFGPPRAASEAGSLQVRFLNPKHYAKTPKDTDDYPFGGGPGMVLRPEPLIRAITDATSDEGGMVLVASARGRLLCQEWIKELAAQPHLVIVCGRYKDIDERVMRWADEGFSVGNLIVSGGEGPGIILLDAVARLLPGALGDQDSARDDSFEENMLGHPSYTKPREYLGLGVPAVLLSGDHARIEKWRKRQALLYTLRLRPDLLARRNTGSDDMEILRESLKEEKNCGRSDKGH
ncbi:MAG: tRNA (guanosine(37)-N1)-methyltransferase TrmD [candidate division WOR-3 bacterium]